MIRDKNPSLVARLFGKGKVWSGCKAGTTKRKSFPEHREKQDLRVTRKKVLPEGGRMLCGTSRSIKLGEQLSEEHPMFLYRVGIGPDCKCRVTRN